MALLPGCIHACPPRSPSCRSILHALRQGWKSHGLYRPREPRAAALGLPPQRRILPRDRNAPVRFYQTTAVPSYPCFVNCVFQAAPTPCGLDPFLFLCSWLKQLPHNLCCFVCSSLLLASAISTQAWSLDRVSRADACSSVSLQLLLEVSRMLELVRDGSKPRGECAGLCSGALCSPVLHPVTCFKG